MSDLLTKDQASLIVQKLMADIPYNINIMNEFGVIIASGEKARLGERHRAAERAIQQKRMVEVVHDTSLEKKGTNEPIIFNDEIIGVVGISGEPAEVRPFTKLVKSIALLLVEELNEFSKKERKNNRKNEFLRNVLLANGRYSEELQKEALEDYRLNLKLGNYCIMAESKRDLSESYPLQEVFDWQGKAIVLVEKLNAGLRQKSGSFIVSSPKIAIDQTIRAVWNTYLFLNFFGLYEQKVFYTKDYYFAGLFDFPLELDSELLKRVENCYDEYYATLILFAKNNTNANLTSSQLHIHRNTLGYRIQKITELTGCDPHVWYELCQLIYHFAYCFKMRFEAHG